MIYEAERNVRRTVAKMQNGPDSGSRRLFLPNCDSDSDILYVLRSHFEGSLLAFSLRPALLLFLHLAPMTLPLRVESNIEHRG